MRLLFLFLLMVSRSCHHWTVLILLKVQCTVPDSYWHCFVSTVKVDNQLMLFWVKHDGKSHFFMTFPSARQTTHAQLHNSLKYASLYMDEPRRSSVILHPSPIHTHNNHKGGTTPCGCIWTCKENNSASWDKSPACTCLLINCLTDKPRKKHLILMLHKAQKSCTSWMNLNPPHPDNSLCWMCNCFQF